MQHFNSALFTFNLPFQLNLYNNNIVASTGSVDLGGCAHVLCKSVRLRFSPPLLQLPGLQITAVCSGVKLAQLRPTPSYPPPALFAPACSTHLGPFLWFSIKHLTQNRTAGCT